MWTSCYIFHSLRHPRLVEILISSVVHTTFFPSPHLFFYASFIRIYLINIRGLRERRKEEARFVHWVSEGRKDMNVFRSLLSFFLSFLGVERKKPFYEVRFLKSRPLKGSSRFCIPILALEKCPLLLTSTLKIFKKTFIHPSIHFVTWLFHHHKQLTIWLEARDVRKWIRKILTGFSFSLDWSQLRDSSTWALWQPLDGWRIHSREEMEKRERKEKRAKRRKKLWTRVGQGNW